MDRVSLLARLAPPAGQLAHAIQLVVQRLQADAENLGRTRLVVARVLQCQHDQAPFRLVHRGPRRERDGRQRLLALRDQGGREVSRLDEIAFGQDRRALHDVAELTNVPRPEILLEQVDRFLIHGADRLAVALVELRQEVLGQQRDVLPAIAQRRQLDGEHVQPVIQVLAQLARLDRLHRVDVGCGNHPHIHRLLLAAAQPPERPLLQDPQQLDLRRRHHLGDLVEKQRAAMRQLEHTRAPVVCPREGALLVPEDLALEQRLGNRRAVDRHERKRRARAQLVDRLGDELLAGARLTRDQHRGQRRRGLLDHPVDGPDTRAVADDLAERAGLAQLPPEVPHLAQRVLPLDRLLQEDLQPLRIDRLAQVVVGPFLDRLDGGFHGALRGEENQRQVRQLVLQRAQQLHPSHPRHHHVADDDGGAEAGHFTEALLAVGGLLGLETPGLNELRQPFPRRRVVFDDQDAFTKRLRLGWALHFCVFSYIHPARLTLCE